MREHEAITRPQTASRPRTQKLRKPPELFRFIGLSAPGGTRTRMPSGHRSSTCRVCLFRHRGMVLKLYPRFSHLSTSEK